MLLVVSLFIIFYKFAAIPKNLSFDEVDFAKLALSLDGNPYTVYSPLATGHSTLYFYILLEFFKLFGINSFALRLPSAIFGIINVLLVFILMNKVFKNNLMAFITAGIFLTMRWYFNFARFSFEATFLLFLELTSIYFLLKLLDYDKKPKMANMIISAVFAGLAFHSYYPGRIFFLLPATWIFMTLPKKYFMQFILVIGIMIAPLIWYNTFYPDVRVSQISFLSDPEISMDYKLKGVASNITSTMLMPFWKGDMNGRHNFPSKPALNPLLSLLFLSGIIISILKPSSKKTTLFFLSYLIISIIPTLLTSPNDNPNMLRTFTVIPSIIYFIGLAIVWMYDDFKKKRRSYLFYPFLLLFMILSIGYELRTYFIFQSRVFNNSFEVTCELADVVTEEIVPKSCRVQSNMF